MSSQRQHPEAPPERVVHDQAAESNHVHAVPAAAPMTSAQAHGFWFGALVGGAIGVVVFGLIGLIPFTDLDVGWRVLITAIVGALTGGTIGAVYFGGRMPELEGETNDADGSPAIGTSQRDPGAASSTGRRR